LWVLILNLQATDNRIFILTIGISILCGVWYFTTALNSVGNGRDRSLQKSCKDFVKVRTERCSVPKTYQDDASSVIEERALTCFNCVGSSFILPMTLTGLAGLISSPLLAGVGPKKRHIALPGGQ